jgi:hypothetical protein
MTLAIFLQLHLLHKIMVLIPWKIYEKTHFIVIMVYKMYKAKVYGIIYTCRIIFEKMMENKILWWCTT